MLRKEIKSIKKRSLINSNIERKIKGSKRTNMYSS